MKFTLGAAAVLLAVAETVFAGYGAGDDRLEALYKSFVAPCCWRDDLSIHQSATADELRLRIQNWVEAGRSDEEIKMALVGEYGKRILIVPEGSARGWLFWTPWLLAAAGLAVVAAFLRRMRRARRAPTGEGTPAAVPGE